MKIPTVNSTNSPLSETQATWLTQFIEGLTPSQLAWLGGFFTGVNGIAQPAVTPMAGSASATAAGAITILFGSQSGHSENVAQTAKSKALARGLAAVVKDMSEYKLPNLKNEKQLLVVVSTYGDGDPPDNVIEFRDFLLGKRAPRLEHTEFSVLALGDTTYERFCHTGKEFDRRIEELGATRIFPRTDCDVDYEEAAERWIDGALDVFAAKMATAPAMRLLVATPGSLAAGPSAYSKKHPFPARLLDRVRLTGRGSDKETLHLELSIADSGLTYEPGDALGVCPINAPDVVGNLLSALAFDGTTAVPTYEGAKSLEEAFSRLYEITILTKPLMVAYAEHAKSAALNDLLNEGNADQLAQYMYGREVVDLVSDFPVKEITPDVVIGLLRKLPPRLYSIASSLRAHPDEVHVTVAVVRYHSHGRDRLGVCTSYLADRIDDEHPLAVYVDANKNFKLPTDPARAIIMIGPGTGVAPFRAFMEEREIQGASGKSWLFFGERHFTTDFLYQIEWQRWLREGVLTRMDVAFSRDQAEKIYVQHRLLEKGKEVYAWLEEGAYLYVCGDADHMAPDVHAALHQIVQREGGKSAEHAAEYIRSLQKSKQYQRDVY